MPPPPADLAHCRPSLWARESVDYRMGKLAIQKACGHDLKLFGP